MLYVRSYVQLLPCNSAIRHIVHISRIVKMAVLSHNFMLTVTFLRRRAVELSTH